MLSGQDVHWGTQRLFSITMIKANKQINIRFGVIVHAKGRVEEIIQTIEN